MCNAFCCITVILTQTRSLTAHISREFVKFAYLKNGLKVSFRGLSCDLFRLILEERGVLCCNGTFP